MSSCHCGDEGVVVNDTEPKTLLKGITVSRLTLPDDANIYGNVHGGTILKMIEDAGTIIATRYCNQAAPRSEVCVAAMVRIEHMDFLLPMKIGEVAELTAEIVYTSPHSLLVEIIVHAENIITGVKHVTNRARLWYVPVAEQDKVLDVPPMPYESHEQEAIGRDAYEEQKAYRLKNVDNPYDFSRETPNAVCLSVLIGANDVTFTRHCRAGVLLKLMDECAGIVAAKHCQKNVVTACLNATNFYKMIPIGALVTVRGLLTFTSARSMDIEVVVEYESVFEKNGSSSNGCGNKAVDAFFTFVSIDDQGKALPVPLLQINSDDDRARFEAGKLRYEERRRKLAVQHQRRQQQQQQQLSNGAQH